MAASTINTSATGATTNTLSATLVTTTSLRLGNCWASRSASVSATSWAMTLSASGVENLMSWSMPRLVLSHWARLSSMTMLMVDAPCGGLG